MTHTPAPDIQHLIALLCADGFEAPITNPKADWFGDGPAMARELGELVRRGVKTATASLLWAWEAEGEALPRAGDIEIVVDWEGNPLAVIETVEVCVMPFEGIDAAFAYDEGEDDRSLKAWRAGHWRYFTRECVRISREPSQTMPVVCQRFRLLHAMSRRESE